MRLRQLRFFGFLAGPLLGALLGLGPAAAQALWPFSTPDPNPVRLVWSDGATSDGLLYGAEPAQLNPAQRVFPAASPLKSGTEREASFYRSHFAFRVEFPDVAGHWLVSPLTLRRIEWMPMEFHLVGSDATARYFSLGPPEERLPRPPDWHVAWNDSPLWRSSRLASVDARWMYLPGAAWLWTSSSWRPAIGEEVLFRQNFHLPPSERILSAVLSVEADRQLRDCYLNGVVLPWEPQALGGRVLRANVERLLKPGDNRIALAVASPHTGEIASAGMAWQLQLLTAPSQSSAAPAPFTIRLMDGSRLMAERVRLTEREVLLRRATGGEVRLARQAVRWIELWPASASASTDRTTTGSPPLSPAVQAAYDESQESEGVWTLDGHFLRGHLANWNPSPHTHAAVDRREWRGDDADRPAARIVPRAVLVSPSAGEIRWDVPEADLLRQTRVILNDGSWLSGWIETSKPNAWNLRLVGDTRLTFRPEELIRMEFPTAPSLTARRGLARILTHSRGTPRIGILGEVPCRGGPSCPESIVPPLQRVAQAMGIELHWIKPTEIIAPETFNPERFPILLNLDQSEAYYHTISRPGDGHQALLEYMNQGGILIHLAPGTPFYYGRQAHARQWALVPLGGAINRAFGLGISAPGDSGNEQLFEVPDNAPAPLQFECVAPPSWAAGLPGRVLFPSTSDARFRPIAPQSFRMGGTLIPLYRLVRDQRDYGLAAAVVRLRPPNQPGARPAYAVYLAWPLVQSRDELEDSLLPHLLPALLEAVSRDVGGL